ncbi:MAG: DNA-binding protein [Euryarchaeota archaeon]|nr:DNA-binding protein [Euryarchaeota archaeon]
MEAIEAKVLDWLMSGNDDASDVVNLPWKVEEIEKGVYTAEHPSVPMHLMVMFSERFVHLIVPTTIETDSMEENERMDVYKKLLMLNERIHMMKFAIGEPNGQIRLLVDLDKETLGKDEFNDALTSLVIGVLAGVMALGIEEEFVQKVFARIVSMLVEKIQKGASEEELMEFLTVKVGMDVRDARDLLDAVLNAMND